MIGLLQRVSHAHVQVDGNTIGEIQQGLLMLIGIEKGDTTVQADKLLNKLLRYRVFADDAGKMNRSVQDIRGGILFVPQFTLPADTKQGTRPSFSPAADPATGRTLFDYLCQQATGQHSPTATGQFGADMQVSLTNDGPVTFWLHFPPEITHA